MAKIRISALDDSVNSGDCGDYDLFFQSDPSVVSYAILDHILNRFIAFESFGMEGTEDDCGTFLEDIFAIRPLLKGTFHSVKVVFTSGRFTLIPGHLFEPEEKDRYLWFNLPAEPDETILYHRMAHPDIVSIYGVPAGRKEIFAKWYPSSVPFHQSAVLIESVWMQNKNRIGEAQLFINSRESEFDLLVFDVRGLRYCNSFRVKTPEDLVYYLIFVMEQLDLNPENATVTISGDMEREDPCHRLLMKYIRFVEFARRNDSHEYSFAFEKVPAHAFLTLFNLALCGS